jgi:hypothetical protein
MRKRTTQIDAFPQASLAYFRWRRSMNGGNVSSSPMANRMNAITLTLAKATVFIRHCGFRMNHDTSQTMIATVVTPEGVPV